MNIAKTTNAEPRLSYLIARLHRRIRTSLGRALAPFELSVAQYTALSVLRHGSGLSNAQLARRTHVTPQAMHQILTSLEADALVVRRTSTDHRQVRLAALTPAGERVLAKCDVVVDQLERELFTGLSRSEMQRLRQLVEQSIT